MKKVKIKIKYSRAFEIKRVIETLKKYNWLKKKGYFLSLPPGLNLKTKENFKADYIKKLLEKEYCEKDYKKISLLIKREWNKLTSILPRKFSVYWIKIEPIYYIFLTKYGTKGSYEMPKGIIINIKERSLKDIIRIIIHEIIHLLVENLIKKYKLGHWQKERLIDLIFSKTFPKFGKKQKLPREAYTVDKAFNKFYPDIRSTIKFLARQNNLYTSKFTKDEILW